MQSVVHYKQFVNINWLFGDVMSEKLGATKMNTMNARLTC